MNPTPARRLTLADLALLIAAAAVTLVVARDLHGVTGPMMAMMQRNEEAAFYATPALLSGSAAVLLARFLRPRPRLRGAFRQPGTVACTVILAAYSYAFAMSLLAGGLRYLAGSEPGMPLHILNVTSHALSLGGPVALAWTIMALAGCLRAEASWVDRAGRGLGVFAMVIEVAARIVW